MRNNWTKKVTDEQLESRLNGHEYFNYIGEIRKQNFFKNSLLSLITNVHCWFKNEPTFTW